jgi:BlaI family transcriptional regulator, penicillinase repressor
LQRSSLSKLEYRIMDILWSKGDCSIREILEGFPARNRPAYTTVQTIVYRLEEKKSVRRVKKVGNFHIFSPAVSRDFAQRRLVDDLLDMFGGLSLPLMAHLIESGKVSRQDVSEAEKLLQDLSEKEVQS